MNEDIETVYIDDYESSECDSGSTGQLAANQLYNLVDLTVAFRQKSLFSTTYTHTRTHYRSYVYTKGRRFSDHSVKVRALTCIPPSTAIASVT